MSELVDFKFEVLKALSEIHSAVSDISGTLSELNPGENMDSVWISLNRAKLIIQKLEKANGPILMYP